MIPNNPYNYCALLFTILFCLYSAGECSVCESGNQTYTDCGSSCPRTCSPVNDSRVFCPAVCTKGCFCSPGYVSSSKGCILPVDCPIAETCAYDEEYCSCGSACEKRCDNYYEPLRCPAQCVEGCFCKKGTVRNQEGRCVPVSQCPPERCPQNEYWKTCGRVCEKTCSTPEIKICPRICPRPACSCSDGFVRDEQTDLCVRLSECTKQCPIGEKYNSCGTACPRTCRNYNKPIPCTLQCVEGCFCEGDTVRNDDGICVPISECPAQQCCDGEEYSDCGPSSEATCDNQQDCGVDPETCVSGCFCQEGLVRDVNTGACIPTSECPQQCCENEVYLSCGTACPDTCENYDDTTRMCTYQCVPGCFCRDGYVRNGDNICVPPSQCPTRCMENEDYLTCGTACPVTCENYNQSRLRCTEYCVEACFCKPGLIRDTTTGLCVIPENCPVQCGLNEEYQLCGTACPDTCDNYQDTNRICTMQCVSGCFCQDGYVRDPRTSECVLTEQCTEQCGDHEVFTTCGTLCPDTCENYLNKSAICPTLCVKGCFCEEGYVRDRITSECVLPEECTQQCGDHEVFTTCGTLCPDTCENYLNKTVICPTLCVKGCFCQEGYVRDSNGICVLPSECPVCCNENEEYLTCGSACPDTCENFRDSNRLCTKQCVSGCFCKSGLVRNTNTGQCVLPEQCPSQCPSNEVYKPCGTCEPNCNNYKDANRPCFAKCVEGCFCQEGYVRNENGLCVLPCECPPQCGCDEEYTECGAGCEVTCDNQIIPREHGCTPGCICKSGLVRDTTTGNCVLPSACPQMQCNANEIYNLCGTACEATCDNFQDIGPCTTQCVPGCFCKEGYVRDQNGNCILISQCPPAQICPDNEVYFERGSACPDTCDNLGTLRKCIDLSVRGCFCKEGFVRNCQGVCVNPRECPDTGLCPINEEYQICSREYQFSCENYTNPYPLDIPECYRGCVCKQGYVRNKNNDCILPSQCPVVCGINEQYLSCGTSCPDTCSNMGMRRVCPRICVSGCFCLPGYVRNNSGACILPSECPGRQVCTKPNEEYQQCGTLCPDTCQNLGTYRNCLPVCVPGCFCRKGFVRNYNGNCVLPSECSSGCTGPNEYFSCGSACDTECATLGEVCPIINIKCTERCYCYNGYARDASGICIPQYQCPPKSLNCSGPNEHYACGSACDNECKTLGEPCPIINVRCNDRCYCNEGFARNNFGICIPEYQCPPKPPKIICTGPNEHYECGSPCDTTCATLGEVCPIVNIKCTEGCYCNKGYARDNCGVCIPTYQCPPKLC